MPIFGMSNLCMGVFPTRIRRGKIAKLGAEKMRFSDGKKTLRRRGFDGFQPWKVARDT